MNILLIDLSSIVHPIWHMSASDPDPNATSIKTVARVRALASGQPHVAICCDSGRSFRRDISADYKAQRPPSDATLQHQMTLAVETLKADGFPVWDAKGFEADDVIASATAAALRWYRESDAGRDTATVTIASADKDLLQLIGPSVTVHKLTDGTDWDEDKVLLHFGVPPCGVVDWLSLVGDASDNVKGAKGIGAKKATELLSKYGNLEDLYAALDSHGSDFTPALATNLRDFHPRLAEVRSLITLRRDVPVRFAEVIAPRVPADVAIFDGGEDVMVDVQDDAPARASVAPAATEPARVVPAAPSAATVAAEPEAPKAAPKVELVPDSPAPPMHGDYERALEPRDMRQAWWIAEQMFKSRLFSAYGTPQGVLATILAGREMGLTAMASLRGFHIIEGKPTMAADLIRALILRSPVCEAFYCTERAADHATFVTTRKGQPPMALTYTFEDAKAAGMVKPGGGWVKNPADMCVARASAKLARLVYPDVVHGLYAPEELES